MSFDIKRNDRSPTFTATLTAGDVPVDLSGASVKFLMTLLGASSATINAAATIVSATAGSVAYSWGAGDTATAGLYIAEFEVTFAGGLKRTFPERDYLYVNIVPDLG